MSSIIENKNRIACLTSSEAHKLLSNSKDKTKPGVPFYTYVNEKKIERRLGRSIDTEKYTKDLAWGTFLESRVYRMLPYEYELTSNQTDTHPVYPTWAGSKDFIVPGVKISELKCYQPKHFATYTDALLTKDTEIIKKECPEEYWQLVSNACINQVSIAEAITYMPYKSELQEIRDMAENYDGDDQWKYRFIVESEDAALAYLPDGGYYENLNIFAFTVPQEDIELLTARIILATELLNA